MLKHDSQAEPRLVALIVGSSENITPILPFAMVGKQVQLTAANQQLRILN
jgi:hypothetical protein